VGNILNYIKPQNALRRGYSILTIVKIIKHGKERSVGLFRAILRVFKQKEWPF